MSKEWYILILNVNTENGVADLPGLIQKIHPLFHTYPDECTCLHSVKLTGEPRVFAVFEVTDVIALERIVTHILQTGGVTLVCKPLIQYQTFAESLGVDKALTTNRENSLKDAKKMFLLQTSVEYPDRTTGELIDMWNREATAVLEARAEKGNFELFKSVVERKIYAFVAMDAAVMDGMAFSLPMMKEHGHGVQTLCNAVQSIDDYCARMFS